MSYLPVGPLHCSVAIAAAGGFGAGFRAVCLGSGGVNARGVTGCADHATGVVALTVCGCRLPHAVVGVGRC